MKHKLLFATLLTALCTMSAPPAVYAAGHEKVLGIQGGFISRNTGAEGGFFFQYGFSHIVRAELDASIAFRNKDRDAMLLDLNAQFPFHISHRCELYPLAGLNYSSWSHHARIPASESAGDDVTTRHGYFGLNAGAGFGCAVTPTFKFKAEAMFTAVKSNSAARIMVGIGYSF